MTDFDIGARIVRLSRLNMLHTPRRPLRLRDRRPARRYLSSVVLDAIIASPITVTDRAKMLGLKRSTFAACLTQTNRVSPDAPWLDKLAHALDLDRADLLDPEDAPSDLSLSPFMSCALPPGWPWVPFTAGS